MVITASPVAHATDNQPLAAAKAAHAEIVTPTINPAGATHPAEPTLTQPRQPGTATPDEVAARIAVRLAQLRASETTEKYRPKRKPSSKPAYRPSLPATTAKAVGEQPIACESSGKCFSI